MTVFPLEISREEDTRRYVCLDDAVDRGYIKIHEKGSATVSGIDVENVSDRYVFLMAGEILGGGKQNRIIAKDVLLQPRGRIVSVPVYCVEQHRWSHSGGKGFYSEKTVAPNAMRAMTQTGGSQGKVWEHVDRVAEANRVKSSTGSFQAVYEDAGVKRQIDAYDSLRRMPRHTVGVVVAVNGTIIGAEVFCNEDLFDDLWPKLLRSYSLDAVSWHPGVRSTRYRLPNVDRDDIRRYLNGVYRSRYTEENGVDAGHFLELSGVITGKAMVFRRAVMHLNLAGARHMHLERGEY
jgi:hypothetical protein